MQRPLAVTLSAPSSTPASGLWGRQPHCTASAPTILSVLPPVHLASQIVHESASLPELATLAKQTPPPPHSHPLLHPHPCCPGTPFSPELCDLRLADLSTTPAAGKGLGVNPLIPGLHRQGATSNTIPGGIFCIFTARLLRKLHSQGVRGQVVWSGGLQIGWGAGSCEWGRWTRLTMERGGQ